MSIYKDDHRNIAHSLVLSCVKDGAAFLMKHLNVTNDSLSAPQLGPRVCIDLCYASSARAIANQPPSAAPLKISDFAASHLSLSLLSLCLFRRHMYTARLVGGAARQWLLHTCSTSGMSGLFVFVLSSVLHTRVTRTSQSSPLIFMAAPHTLERPTY